MIIPISKYLFNMIQFWKCALFFSVFLLFFSTIKAQDSAVSFKSGSRDRYTVNDLFNPFANDALVLNDGGKTAFLFSPAYGYASPNGYSNTEYSRIQKISSDSIPYASKVIITDIPGSKNSTPFSVALLNGKLYAFFCNREKYGEQVHEQINNDDQIQEVYACELDKDLLTIISQPIKIFTCTWNNDYLMEAMPVVIQSVDQQKLCLLKLEHLKGKGMFVNAKIFDESFLFGTEVNLAINCRNNVFSASSFIITNDGILLFTGHEVYDSGFGKPETTNDLGLLWHIVTINEKDKSIIDRIANCGDKTIIGLLTAFTSTNEIISCGFFTVPEKYCLAVAGAVYIRCNINDTTSPLVVLHPFVEENEGANTKNYFKSKNIVVKSDGTAILISHKVSSSSPVKNASFAKQRWCITETWPIKDNIVSSIDITYFDKNGELFKSNSIILPTAVEQTSKFIFTSDFVTILQDDKVQFVYEDFKENSGKYSSLLTSCLLNENGETSKRDVVIDRPFSSESIITESTDLVENNCYVFLMEINDPKVVYNPKYISIGNSPKFFIGRIDCGK
jgi:hypothetical protein